MMPNTEKHGLLTLDRPAYGMAPRFFVWRCDCGVEKVASLTDVRRGVIASCGCLKAKNLELARSKRGQIVNDLTGRRFGMLVVVDRAENNKHGCAVWRCICDCGGEKAVSGNHLVTGNTASCGCAYRESKVVRPADARARSNAYVKGRYRSDLRYSLNRRALQLVHACLRCRGGKKNARWEQLVGYSIEALEQHLQTTIPEGFTWADFMSGALHVDHKVPLSAFNFTSAEDLDFHRAWALSNLQLLPAEDNIKKAAKLSAPFQPSLCF